MRTREIEGKIIGGAVFEGVDILLDIFEGKNKERHFGENFGKIRREEIRCLEWNLREFGGWIEGETESFLVGDENCVGEEFLDHDIFLDEIFWETETLNEGLGTSGRLFLEIIR